MKPEIVVAHAVDTEGPLYESVSAKFERLQEIFGIEIEERTPKTFDALLSGEIDVQIQFKHRQNQRQNAMHRKSNNKSNEKLRNKKQTIQQQKQMQLIEKENENQ